MPQKARPSIGSRLFVGLKVFFSYSHRDERLRKELDKHLSPLRRSGLINTWYDGKIMPGEEIDVEVAQHLRTSDLVLLLVSPDFIESEYCYGREMRTALKRHASGATRVIPIILRAVDWKTTPLGKLLGLPTDAKPVASWNRRDEALLDVANGVRRAAEEMKSTRLQQPYPPRHAKRNSKAKGRQ